MSAWIPPIIRRWFARSEEVPDNVVPLPLPQKDIQLQLLEQQYHNTKLQIHLEHLKLRNAKVFAVLIILAGIVVVLRWLP